MSLYIPEEESNTNIVEFTDIDTLVTTTCKKSAIEYLQHVDDFYRVKICYFDTHNVISKEEYNNIKAIF